MRVEHVRVPAATTASEAVALVRSLAEQKGIQLEVECPAGEGFVYVGDDDRVRQILMNLISNAIKFTEAGGEITVTCGSGTPPPGERRRARSLRVDLLAQLPARFAHALCPARWRRCHL